MKTQFNIKYTKRIGGQSNVILNACNEKEALNNAKQIRMTGKDFKVITI